MTAVAGDVPQKYDVVIDGVGYIYDNAPAGQGMAKHSHTPLFLERINMEGDYGDNTYDFFLTQSQTDWSLGEGQKYFRSDDADRARRYWQGDLDVSTIGEAVLPKQWTREIVSTDTSGTWETEAYTVAKMALVSDYIYLYLAKEDASDLWWRGSGDSTWYTSSVTSASNIYINDMLLHDNDAWLLQDSDVSWNTLSQTTTSFTVNIAPTTTGAIGYLTNYNRRLYALINNYDSNNICTSNLVSWTDKNDTSYVVEFTFSSELAVGADNIGNRLAIVTGTEHPATTGANGQLNRPMGIAVKTNGHVFVTEQSPDRVEEFDSAGNYVGQFGSYGTGTGSFDRPWGIGVYNTTGDIYVADYMNERIVRWHNGTHDITRSLSPGVKPMGLTIDQTYGDVYVCCDDHYMRKYDANLGFLTQWFVAGAGPLDAVVMGNFIWISQYLQTPKISKWTLTGTFIEYFYITDSSSNQQCMPYGLDKGPNNNLYVSNSMVAEGGDSIRYFNTSGVLQGSFAPKGPAVNEMLETRGLVTTATGLTTAVDFIGNSGKEYSDTGTYVTRWGVFNSWQGAIDLRVYTWDGSSVVPLAYLPQGFSLSNRIPTTGERRRDNSLQYDATAANGNYLYIGGVNCDTGLAQIRYVGLDGTTGVLWDAKDTPFEINHITTVAADAGDGILWGSNNGLIYNYNPSNGAVTQLQRLPMGNTSYPDVNGIGYLQNTLYAVGYNESEGYTHLYYYAGIANSGTIYTSLFDFNNNLTKIFQEVIVDCEINDTGSYDILLQMDDLEPGGWITGATGITTDGRYSLTSPTLLTGRSIAIGITLHKGTTSPVLKRIFVRAVPVIDSFKLREYQLKCVDNVQTNNRDIEKTTGQSLANALITSSEKQQILSITDRFGTFNGVIERDKLEFQEIRKGEYKATVVVREV